jgi:hypothetical protein
LSDPALVLAEEVIREFGIGHKIRNLLAEYTDCGGKTDQMIASSAK